ncbi:hypothetical protein AK812_SmicGene13804 [Symbiodinium microadriaticum]|uniref:Uncharacterized protein n=1 Tax=Symbiodinium microadriaticum TaxID=2951 RepID=A0A1Q9E744_SYMMI|nr:hypothetical protein AK812_SmicGene13804 [Symbiodinium microadriaticum]
MLGSSERRGDMKRAVAVLTHLSIFPRVAPSPSWRVLLAAAAVLLLWRSCGTRAALAARAILQEAAGRRSQVGGALEQRLDDLLMSREARNSSMQQSHRQRAPAATAAVPVFSSRGLSEQVVLAFALGQVVLSSGCLLRVASALLLERHVPMSDVFGKPLQQLGAMMGDPPNKREEKKKKKGSGEGKRKSVSKRDTSAFNPRSEAEVREVVERWKEYVHPRAREFFEKPEQLEEVLTQLAKGTDKTDDPILGPDEKCVYWYGDVTKDDLQAAIRMIKPKEEVESVTYVNRVLAFIFATDDSFEKLMALPKEPFKMSCGDQLCVHLAHISLAVS